MPIEKSATFELAEKYVQETGMSIFLTGKAGTGKTTFLRHIVENTTKRFVVVAPTGIAAINAGGVTIHSFFRLPLCPYLPDVKELMTEYQDPKAFPSLKKERIAIIKSLELLIIDEISMVRADLLDAVDFVLRKFRRSDRPFGGVQLLMIGDVQQLPPVVRDQEKQFMDRVYPSPFFFYSKALAKLEYMVIQLEKVHRQKDSDFVSILNDIREGHPSADTIRTLNKRLDPSFVPPQNEKWIRLTTHNSQADSVNASMMKALKGKEQSYEAEINGTFPENSYPADLSLKLKAGAQVMFVRNDTSGDARYYNGKIATVVQVKPDIIVEDESGEQILVGQEEWSNTRYEMDEESGQIKSVVDGTFSQFPLRLAWAITIHKSQGLSFDRVIIDAAHAFSSGQVYVALSRCRTLEGIVLSSPVTARAAFSSAEVVSFEKTYTPLAFAAESLDACKLRFLADTVCDAFDFRQLRLLYNRLDREFMVNLSNIFFDQANLYHSLASQSEDFCGVHGLTDISNKFHQQLRTILHSNGGNLSDARFVERIVKASKYFVANLISFARLLRPQLDVEITDKANRIAFRKATVNLVNELSFRIEFYSELEIKPFSSGRYMELRNHYEKQALSFKATLKALDKLVELGGLEPPSKHRTK